MPAFGISQKIKKKKLLNTGWLLISLLCALVVLYFLSINPKTQRAFPFIGKIAAAFPQMAFKRDALWGDLPRCSPW